MSHRKLKSLRVIHEINQLEMSKIAGMGKTAYSMKEQGKRDFSLTEAKRIADYFNTTIDDLFFDQEVLDLRTKEK